MNCIAKYHFDDLLFWLGFRFSLPQPKYIEFIFLVLIIRRLMGYQYFFIPLFTAVYILNHLFDLKKKEERMKAKRHLWRFRNVY